MRQTKYKNKLRRKTIKNKLRRKTIKNRKQVGGQISDNCVREIISLALGDNDNNFTQEQITNLTNKIMTLRSFWVESYQNFFNILNQINGINMLDYDDTNFWVDDLIDMFHENHELN